MAVVNDLNQRYVMDVGLAGPDAGKGGKHLILPHDYKGEFFSSLPQVSTLMENSPGKHVENTGK